MYQPAWKIEVFATRPPFPPYRKPRPFSCKTHKQAVEVVRDYETGNGLNEQAKRRHRYEFARWLYCNGRIHEGVEHRVHH